MTNLRNLLIGATGVVAATAMASSALAASTSASVDATVIQPITITKTADLSWGTIVRPNSGTCSVTMANDGDRAGSTCQLIGAGANTAAFDVTGDGNRTFTIGTDTTVTLTTGDGVGATKQIVFTPAHDATDNTGGSNGTASTKNIKVWGSLVVSNDDVAGAYTGSVTVTVNYQ